MIGLDFATTGALAPADANRADVACFIGYVARRQQAPLPSDVQTALRAGGWVDGPWRRANADLESLLHLPVTLESWDAFDHLFAWDERPVAVGQSARCASYLGAAVRSFFATGGRRAIVVRTGDPWPFVDSAAVRLAARPARVRALVPDYTNPAGRFDPGDPGGWRGIQHVYGLGEASLVCLPDLPDVFATPPTSLPSAFEPPPPPEVFVECSDDEPVFPFDSGLRRLAAPQCDDGYEDWGRTIGAVCTFLKRHQRRDVLLFAALPLPRAEAVRGGAARVHADASLLDFLRQAGVLDRAAEGDTGPGTAASAFVQLGYPWLRTRRSADLPQGLEPPDGILAGLVAANALRRGTFRSIAGSRLDDVVETVPILPRLGAGSPGADLSERVCLIAPDPDGIALQSDVTTSPDTAWRPGGVSRLLAAVVRAARLSGEASLFEPNGPALWTRVRLGMETLLTGFWQQGGLGGATANDGFLVRCDRTTMTQSDIDAGRLFVEVSIQPAAAVERITVVLNLAGGGEAQRELREVA